MTYVISSKQASNVDYKLVLTKRIKRLVPLNRKDAKRRSDAYEKHLKEVADHTS
ncbi:MULTISPECIES: hypothetical protein [Vibrionaceae]|uniref:hypothetical protein n=1 Tax=Vibrionaceae TaxID=641 RepID=UPI0012FFD937|nr:MULTISPECIES: hypothetical protein [Vibrionaceae]